MSPRAYQVGARRQLATKAMRSRIIEAARELLADERASAFTIDAVAERADVARMTIYYQFKSKGKLLEALFDDFGERANMKDLRKAFQDPDPANGLNTLIEVFCHLWKTQRAISRRLNALAALDPEVSTALAERGSWRREALSELIRRVRPDRNTEETIDLLYVLTSFPPTYDELATANREVPPVVAACWHGLLPPGSSSFDDWGVCVGPANGRAPDRSSRGKGVRSIGRRRDRRNGSGLRRACDAEVHVHSPADKPGRSYAIAALLRLFEDARGQPDDERRRTQRR